MAWMLAMPSRATILRKTEARRSTSKSAPRRGWHSLPTHKWWVGNIGRGRAMSKSYGIIVSMGALMLAALFVVESAVAGVTPVEAPTTRVQFHDLNLGDAKAVATLYNRIRNAAAEVCKSAEGPQLVNRMFW